jgi:SAM-dependent methyltransferase
MPISENELPVPAHLQRGLHDSRDDWLESASVAVDVLCRTAGREDLADVELLDVGCGTKIVKALLDHSMPIGGYVGVDVSVEVIDWLKANVSDPRFEFHHINARNALYNPDGEPLEGFELLPVGPRRFDLISLFSVFTHLAPDDYVVMLRLLRRHVKPDGILLFSLHLVDSDHPTPFEEAVRRHLRSEDPDIRARAVANVEKALQRRATGPHDPRFIDEHPTQPLTIARYTKDYAIELVEETDWEIEAIHRPHPKGYIQHYMVCRPA